MNLLVQYDANQWLTAKTSRPKMPQFWPWNTVHFCLKMFP